MEEEISKELGFNLFAWGTGLGILFIFLIIWSFVWKGIALWRAGRNNQLAWFIVMLLINTLGILEILYIAFFQSCCDSKKSDSKVQPANNPPKTQ